MPNVSAENPERRKPRPSLPRLIEWMERAGKVPLAHQREAWAAYEQGDSGLIIAPTGTGKTLAAYLAPLARVLDEPMPSGPRGRERRVRIVYITPLRALTRNIAESLAEPVRELELPFSVDQRTGDTSTKDRGRQRRTPPEVMVTTPESLALMLTYKDAEELFGQVVSVIVDEWHSLMATKRGTLLELSLSRLRAIAPSAQTWGMSATLANVDDAACRLSGVGVPPTIVRATTTREVQIEAVLPAEYDDFPGAGYLGLGMVDLLLPRIDPERTTLVFTNTRSQAERWFEAIVSRKPEWFEWIGIHHASVDQAERLRVEQGLRTGRVRLCVCTSSLDLGIDVGRIDLVVQIGSPRSVARLLQRAGRASHRPGATCTILLVPTHSIELMELSALERATAARDIEPIRAFDGALDVLVQHIVSRALGPGFTEAELRGEVATCWAYRALSDEDWASALHFATTGGKTLQGYEHYKRVERDGARYVIKRRRAAMLHRMNMGTITSDAPVAITFRNGRKLGFVDEMYIRRLRPGTVFIFQGRRLELQRVDGLKAYVKVSKKQTSLAPRWGLNRLALSQNLGRYVRQSWTDEDAPALAAHAQLRALVAHQERVSRLPARDGLLIELMQSRDGSHAFVYPFEGERTNEAIGTVIAARLSRREKADIAVTPDEYGVELLTHDGYPFRELIDASLFSSEGLEDDIRDAVNLADLTRAKFRGIARIAGLVVQNFPGKQQGARMLMAQAGLIFDVFRDYDPDNLLLAQAEREVFARDFDLQRLRSAFERFTRSGYVLAEPQEPGPLAMPLMIARVRARVSTESFEERLVRLREEWTNVGASR